MSAAVRVPQLRKFPGFRVQNLGHPGDKERSNSRSLAALGMTTFSCDWGTPRDDDAWFGQSVRKGSGQAWERSEFVFVTSRRMVDSRRILHGNQRSAPKVEDAAGLRDYLFCLGIHFSCNSRWRPRGSAVPFCGDAVLCGGAGALRLDARAGRALTERAPVGVGIPAGSADFRRRLWTVVLGGAARALGHCGRDDGYDPGVHGAVGDYFPANAEAHPSVVFRAANRPWGSGSADEQLLESWRSAGRQGRRRGTHRRIHRLVRGVRTYPQIAAAAL
jgi:hypothetical protein